MPFEFIIVSDRPAYSDRLARLVTESGFEAGAAKSAEQAASIALERRGVGIVVVARDARPLRPLRRLRKQGSNAPILILADEAAIRPLQHVAAWAEFLDRALVIYAPFTDAEFGDCLRKAAEARIKAA